MKTSNLSSLALLGTKLGFAPAQPPNDARSGTTACFKSNHMGFDRFKPERTSWLVGNTIPAPGLRRGKARTTRTITKNGIPK
jgi:hypothetical protein